MAFQILDDILDYSQSFEIFEKPVLEDVKQGIYSLPLILALKEDRKAFLPLLEKRHGMTDADIRDLVGLINKYKGIKKASFIAKSYTEKALKAIAKLPNRPEREILYMLTKNLFDRSF